MSIVTLWSKISVLQKIIATAFFGIVIIFVIFISVYSVRDTDIYLFTNGISDSVQLQKITFRLDQEAVPYTVDSNNRIKVKDVGTARYLRNIIVRENLLPSDTDPWELFDITRWTQTDFERNINLQRSLTKQIKQHIESLDDIDSAEVTLVIPEDTLFESDRNPPSASVILTIKPSSTIREERKKLEGIEQLILFAIEGLTEDNLTISDSSGVVLNNFEDFAAFDDLELTKRQLDIKAGIEKEYKEAIYDALSGIYTPDRVKIVNINVDMDFAKKSQETTENFPIIVRKDNPETPYDESEVVLSIVRAQQTANQTYKGSGFNPEGPPGVEGQVPPSYKDLDGLVAEWTHDTDTFNNEINQRKIVEEKRPEITRITASVALDGIWYTEYDDNGKRVVTSNGSIQRRYEALESAQIRQAKLLVEAAVGYSTDREDIVNVENIQFDRTALFAIEDAKIRAQMRLYRILRISGFVVLGLLIVFIIFRIISQLVESYRLRKEEELANRYRRLREEQISSFQIGEEPESEVDILRKEITHKIKQSPDEVVKLVRLWVDGPVSVTLE